MTFQSVLDMLLQLGVLATPAPVTEGAVCPPDMRLVSGVHYDEMQHICIAPESGHCFEYAAGISAEEGATKDISVCMDVFEAPNRKGAKPLVMQSYESASRQCRRVGKRMCSEEEWETACEGTDHRPWAYGWKARRDVCNSGRAWRAFNVTELSAGGERAEGEVARLWQGAASGSFPACESPYGIADMMGNVEEWVSSRKGRRFKGALMGGFWSKPWTGCRGTNDAHEPTFTFYETGFRCCSDPQVRSSP